MEMNNGFWSDGQKVTFFRDGGEIDPASIPGVKEVVPFFDPERGSGTRLTLTNGNQISIMWRQGNYCANRYSEEVTPFSEDAEIAIFSPSGDWHNFGFDTVEGWQSVDDILGHIATFSRRPISA
jgi:hypothetical protein